MTTVASGDPTSRPGGVNRQTAIAAAVVAAIAIIGIGVFFATRDEDDGGRVVAATTTTEEEDEDDEDTTTTEAVPTTVEAVTTVPATTVPLTVAPPTTAAPTLPPATTAPPPPPPPPPGGALDIGFGVSVPIPAGWESIGSPELPAITDGQLGVRLFAVQRPPGEDPAPLLQVYTDLRDADFEAISYRPIDSFGSLDGGVVPINQYGVTYNIFDPEADDGIGFLGTIYLYQRADGLTVFYDIFALPDVSGTLPDESFSAFIASVLNAPALGPAAPLIPPSVPRITSIHPRVDLFGTAAFTVAPGWETTTLESGQILATIGTADFGLLRVAGAGSLTAALDTARAENEREFPGSTYDAPQTVEGPREGIERADVPWSNTTLPDRQVFGNYSVFYDTRSGNAYILQSAWVNSIENPAFPAVNFMFRSFVDSFTEI